MQILCYFVASGRRIRGSGNHLYRVKGDHRKNTELFIASRLSSRGATGRANPMVRIASATVCVGMAVMIISLAVITGFKAEITAKLVGFGSHLQIVNLDGNASLETAPITRNESMMRAIRGVEGVMSVAPYAVKGGIVKTDEAMQGVMLKGVDGDYDWSFFRGNLREGELPRVGDSVRTKDILISGKLARTMRLKTGDAVQMLFLNEGAPPRRDRFKVSGIYDSGFEEIDMMMIPTDIRNVQRLGGWSGDMITGYEIGLAHFDDIDPVSTRVERAMLDTPDALKEGLMLTDIRQRFPTQFDWLRTLDVNTAVIIVIMLLVAALNMVSALLIILLERTGMVGTLKALGMNSPSLQRLFIYRSAALVLRGMAWGNLTGVGLCLVQKYTGIAKLNESGYFLSEVPVHIGWGWLAWLNVAVFAALVLLMVLPTGIISKIKPETTMRFRG